MKKFFTVIMEPNRKERALKEAFLQICPGGTMFELAHTSANQGNGVGGNVVMIQGVMERSCPSECEKNYARYTYFGKKKEIDVCPLLGKTKTTSE